MDNTERQARHRTKDNQEWTIPRDRQNTEQRQTKQKHNTETIQISNMDTTKNGVELRCSGRATVPVFYKTPLCVTNSQVPEAVIPF